MSDREERGHFFTNLGGKELVDAIQLSDRLLARYTSKQAPPKSANWSIIGAVETAASYARGLRLKCEYGVAEVQIIADNCIRVRVARSFDEMHEPFSYSVAKTEWPQVQYNLSEAYEVIQIRTAALNCLINRYPFQVQLTTLTDETICEDSAGAQLEDGAGVRLSMKLDKNETSYGLGERASGLNLRGNKFALWNTDCDNYERGSDPLYYNIPFYVGVHDEGAYGVFWDNPGRGVADVGHSIHNELIFESESGELRYYLFAGADVKAVVSRYTELTGRIELPPIWFLGYQQSRFSYTSQDEVLRLAREFRQRTIPCDVLYLDIHYMDDFRAFTWDKQRFPAPQEMILRLHRQGFKVIPILNPGVKVDAGYTVYETGRQQDVFLKYPSGELVAGSVWPGLCHFPDFTNATARVWWHRQCKVVLDAGVDGIWNDMCEPVIFGLDGGQTLPDQVVHDGDGHLADHREYHNVYGMLMARASIEAQQAQRPHLRPVNIVRAGFAGTQRYASSWTGDNGSDWDHLRLSLSMTLNMGLSGAPMTGPDIGGFRGNANAELVTRWFQAACLMPYFRNHTSFGTDPQEPWAYGQPYEVINRLVIELRYRFIPYLYAVVAQAREYGWPIIRPLFTAEPYNPHIREIDDCYLLGDAVLVAPVLQPGKTSRSVYLPAGQWYDYWTNECLSGGDTIETPAPLERLPLFIRAGAVLPFWSERQFIGETQDETLTLRVFPGDFETILYEDSGEGMGYADGDYRWVYISAGWDDNTFIVNRRVAGRFEPGYHSMRLEIIGFDDEPADVRVDRKGAPLWFYDDGLLELTVSNFQQLEIIQKSQKTDRTIASRQR